MADTCEHLYLAGNCPYCLINRLKEKLVTLSEERDELSERVDQLRVMHAAAVAEREAAKAEATRERRYKIALQRHIERLKA